jgi:Family of unknown function (DUF6328)
LLPLALGLALILYPVANALRLPGAAWIGGAGGLLAVTFWYGCLLTSRDQKDRQHGQGSRLEQCAPDDESSLSERIKKVLIECRIALPGAQAFLGFQFAIVFAEGFNDLPRSSQLIHFGSLVATTITIVLLLAPHITDWSKQGRILSGFTGWPVACCSPHWCFSHREWPEIYLS